MGIYEKLANIQQALKAPKGQYNRFGKYNYRSCEDIVEAVKPLCSKNGCVLTVTDDVVDISGRVYVRATAMLWDCAEEKSMSVTAYAREPKDKKGMDESQITGMASSYARKYALNGLFCIDDTKDADTNETQMSVPEKKERPAPKNKSVILCEDCGMPILERRFKGTEYSADTIAQNAVEAYGRRLCWDCMKAARAAMETANG